MRADRAMENCFDFTGTPEFSGPHSGSCNLKVKIVWPAGWCSVPSVPPY